MQIVAIGDTHFKVDNMNIVDKLIEEIVSKLSLLQPDLIVLLGDILHDHERLHTLALNRALDFINKLRNIYWIWKINKEYNKLNFFENLISVLSISLNSFKKYGFK